MRRVGEVFNQACSKLDWHGFLYSQVDPGEMKRYVTQLARIIRKTYHGIVILAELEGKIVEYLVEIMSHCRDPYKHQTLTGRPHGKHTVN